LNFGIKFKEDFSLTNRLKHQIALNASLVGYRVEGCHWSGGRWTDWFLL